MCPIVVRGPANGGTNVGATHSHTPENIFANMPGLKVVTPSDAHDAKGLIKSAIRDNDPVYFMESTVLYGMTGLVPSNDET
jgi:pyruvate dehydrogenase E1 component beta subunit